MRRTRVSICVAMAALGGSLAVSCVPAQAAVAPHYVSQFNGSETPAGSFAGWPYAFAANGSGDVYVADSSHNVVDEFGPTGTYTCQIAGTASSAQCGGAGSETPQGALSDAVGVAVNGSADVYVADRSHEVVDEFGPTGTYITQFNGGATPAKSFRPEALAVNASGDIWVSDLAPGHDVVDEFGPTGTYITQVTGSETPAKSFEPYKLAVNGSGDLYVSDTAHAVVDEFSPTGTYLCQLNDTSSSAQCGGASSKTPQASWFPWAVAVNGGGDVYVSDAENNVVDEFSSAGAYLTQFTGSETPAKSFEPYALGVNRSGDVYVGDAAHNVADVFAPEVELTEYSLTVAKTGTGKGTVRSEQQPGINCGTECSHGFAEGEKVKLKETATPGSTFTKWEGCTAELSGVCEVTLSAAMEVKAEYTARTPVAFTPTYAGTGTGEVKCEVDKEGGFVACAATYGEGTELVLDGAAAAGSTFEGWSAGSGSVSSCAGTGTCVFTITEATTITAAFGKAVASPLSVYVTGKGKVNSSPAGIVECASTGGVCEAEFKGLVTLSGTPEAGYVLVGWIGCKKTTEAKCEVNLTAASEVTAVFLKEGKEGTEGKEGKEGKPGEGVKVKEFGPEEHGCEEGGIEVIAASGTTYVCNGPFGEEGKEGRPGANGTNGAQGSSGGQGEKGASGAQGAAGLAGPAGPAGKEGPPGKIELVTCKKVGKRQNCTSKMVSGTVGFTTSSARATLSRHGAVYAAGTARSTRGRLSLRLLPVRKLSPGRYTLMLISGSGRHETIHSEFLLL